MKVFKAIKSLVSGLLAIAIVAGAAWYGWQLMQTPPKAKRKPRTTSSPVVSVVNLVKRNEPITVEAFGTVIPARELNVRTQVRGRVVAMHPGLVLGGVIKENDTLLSIEASDFEIAVRRAEAALAQTETEYKVEQGRQIVAKREWELLKKNEDLANDVDHDLALRKPQLEKVEAMIAAAKSNLEDAKLELSRTKIKATFDAIVMNESVEVGQLIDTQNVIAKLIGANEFWVEARVPIGRLPQIQFATPAKPSGSEETEAATDGSNVEIILETGAEPIVRTGRVLRQLVDLDPDGRMARVLIAIPDPLNLGGDHAGKLVLGSYVRLKIEAGHMNDVYTIPREALRENERVWVRDAEGKLQIRQVQILWRREKDLLVKNGFGMGEQVITSHLSNVLPGMVVRLKGEKDTAVASKQMGDKDGPTKGKPTKGGMKKGGMKKGPGKKSGS